MLQSTNVHKTTTERRSTHCCSSIQLSVTFTHTWHHTEDTWNAAPLNVFSDVRTRDTTQRTRWMQLHSMLCQFHAHVTPHRRHVECSSTQCFCQFYTLVSPHRRHTECSSTQHLVSFTHSCHHTEDTFGKGGGGGGAQCENDLFGYHYV